MFQASPFQPASLQRNPGLSSNMTDRDLSSHLGPVAGSGGLNVQFFYAKVRITSRDPERNGKFEDRLCIAKMPKGDRLTIATRFISEEQAMQDFPREFAMFRQYESVPTSGTPLQELPGISQSQIAILLLNNLRSIEDVADCPAELINGMGMDVRQAYQVAKLWCKNRDDAAPILAQAERDAVLAQRAEALEARLAAAERTNIELQAQIRAMAAMGGAAPAQAQQLGAGGVVMVDRDENLPEAKDLPPTMFEGGMVDGLSDLDDEPQPTATDPLGLTARKGR